MRPTLLTAGTAWTDVPAVQVLGAALGSLLLLAAIRAMFGRRGR